MRLGFGLLGEDCAKLSDHLGTIRGEVAQFFGIGLGVGPSAAKVGRQVVNAERLRAQANEESIARRGADGLIAVGGVEADAACGKPIDVGRDGQRIAVAANDGLQFVDSD